MDIKRRLVIFSMITTVIQGIIAFIMVLCLLIVVVGTVTLSKWIYETGDNLNNIDPDSVVAGWEALFGMFFGIIMVVAIVILILHLVFPLVVNTFLFIYGIRTYKKRDSSDFRKMIKNDSLFKLIGNGIAAAWFLAVALSGIIESLMGLENIVDQVTVAVVMVVLSSPFVVAVIFNIVNLASIKYLPEEAEIPDYDYGYKIEDNSSYHWQ